LSRDSTLSLMYSRLRVGTKTNTTPFTCAGRARTELPEALFNARALAVYSIFLQQNLRKPTVLGTFSHHHPQSSSVE
jgi:hypothetical protein